MFQFKVRDLALRMLHLWLVFPHKVLQSANSALVAELLGAYELCAAHTHAGKLAQASIVGRRSE